MISNKGGEEPAADLPFPSVEVVDIQRPARSLIYTEVALNPGIITGRARRMAADAKGGRGRFPGAR
jgi:hypothetical protein